MKMNYNIAIATIEKAIEDRKAAKQPRDEGLHGALKILKEAAEKISNLEDGSYSYGKPTSEANLVELMLKEKELEEKNS